MKRRNKLFTSYVIFLVCLLVPVVGSANSQITALKNDSGKNFFNINKENNSIVNPTNAFAKFLPSSKAVPNIEGRIFGKALASNAILLNWDAPMSELEIEKIIVFRTTLTDENGTLMPSVGRNFPIDGDSTQYLDNHVEMGVTYEYSIKAVDIAGGESDISDTVEVTTTEVDDEAHHADRVIGDVTPIQATLNIDYLSFDEDLSSYKVLGFYKGELDGVLAWESKGEDNKYPGEITVNVNAGFLHHFVVFPLNPSGNILANGEIITVVAPPHAPEELSAETTPNEVTLSWVDNNDVERIPGGVTYEIEHNGVKIDDAVIEEIDGKLTFTDSGLGVLSSHEYKITTRVGEANVSSVSSINVTTSPLTLVDLGATAIAQNAITLTWTNPNVLENIEEPAVIEIYRDNHKDLVNPADLGYLREININDDNMTTDIMLDFDHKYTYAFKVRVGDDNRSEFSDTVSAVTMLPVVTNLQAGHIGADSIEITWKNVITDPTVVEGREFFHYIYRVGDDDDVLVGDGINGSVSSFIDGGLNALENYQYYIVTESIDNISRASALLEVTTRPYAPSSLRKTNISPNSVTLEWNDDNGRSDVEYLIYRGDGEREEGINTPAFTDVLLKPMFSYEYKVVTKIGDNESLPSTINVTTPPHAPQNLDAPEVGPDFVALEWKNINEWVNEPGEEKLVNKIYRDDDYLDEVDGGETTYIDERVAQGKGYNYTVITCLGDNCSVASDNVKGVTTIPAVTNLKDAKLGPDSIEITWDNDNSRVDPENFMHEIHRSDGKMYLVLGTDSSYKDTTDIAAITEYEYYIITIRIMPEYSASEPSAPLSVTTPPHAPGELRMTDVTSTGVTLAWNDINNAEGITYVVSRSDGEGEEQIVFPAITEPTFTDDSGLTRFTSYNYKIVTKVGTNESFPSSIEVVTRPHAPVRLDTSEVTSDSVTLVWENVNNFTDVPGDFVNEIYRDGRFHDFVDGEEATYTDRTVSESGRYTYTVRTRIGDNSSVDSNPIDVKVGVALQPVRNLQLGDLQADSVELVWENTGVTEIEDEELEHVIYRDGVPHGTAGVEDESYIDDKVMPITEYEYHIVTRTKSGNSISGSSITLKVTTRPHVPKNLAVTAIIPGSVTLEWDAAAGLEDVEEIAYEIYRNDKPIDEPIDEVEGDVTSFTDNTVAALAKYTYTVKTRVGGNNRSVPSNEAEAETLLQEVQNLRSDDIQAGSVELTWDNVIADTALAAAEEGDIVHLIYRGDGLGPINPSEFELIDTIDGSRNSYVDDGLVALENYQYYIVTEVSSEESDNSDILTVTTRPNKAINLTADFNMIPEAIVIRWENTNPSHNVVHDLYREVDNNIERIMGSSRDTWHVDHSKLAGKDVVYTVVTRLGGNSSVPSDELVVSVPSKTGGEISGAEISLEGYADNDILEHKIVTPGVSSEDNVGNATLEAESYAQPPHEDNVDNAISEAESYVQLPHEDNEEIVSNYVSPVSE